MSIFWFHDRRVDSFCFARTADVRGGHLIHYRVLMEPIANNVFFLAPEALSLGGNYRLVSRDDAGAVFNH